MRFAVDLFRMVVRVEVLDEDAGDANMRDRIGIEKVQVRDAALASICASIAGRVVGKSSSWSCTLG